MREAKAWWQHRCGRIDIVCSRKFCICYLTLSKKLKPCISKVLLPLCLPVPPFNEQCGIIPLEHYDLSLGKEYKGE
jgi:hypothetical protein